MQVARWTGRVFMMAFCAALAAEAREDDYAACDARLYGQLRQIDPCSLVKARIDPSGQKVFYEGTVWSAIGGGAVRHELGKRQAVVRNLLRLQIDGDRYVREFAPQLAALLEEAGAKLERTVTFAALDPVKSTAMKPHMPSVADYCAQKGGGESEYDMSAKRLCGVEPIYADFRLLYGDGIGFALSGSENGFGFPAIKMDSFYCDYQPFSNGTHWFPVSEWASRAESCDHALVLITGVNKRHTLWTGKVYALSAAASASLYRWYRNDCVRVNERGSGGDPLVYDTTFFDAAGDEVALSAFTVERRHLVNIDYGDAQQRGGKSRRVWYVSPFVRCCAEEYLQWKDYILDRNLLPVVDSIQVSRAVSLFYGETITTKGENK